MSTLVVSSPGREAGPHWSHAIAAALAAALIQRGRPVRWLAAAPPSHALPTVDGAVAERFDCSERPALQALAVRQRHAPLERTLTAALREWPQARVVHLGVGAGGSLNVLWLADRLGSRGAAMLRADEVLCARGDLVDRNGAACLQHDSPQRCRWCCAGALWRRTHPSEFQNRRDLLYAGLIAAECLQVPADVDAEALVGFGVPAARLRTGDGPAELLAWCLSP